MAIHPDSIFLDDDTDATLQHRIKRAIVEGILSGRFRSGERMPSSRALAKRLGVSRITVTIAYTDLVADDYLTSKGRSGYYVSENAPTLAPFEMPKRNSESFDWARMLNHRSVGSPPITRPANWQEYPFPFIYGQADPALIDHQNWRLCALQALGKGEFTSLTPDQYERDDPKLVDYIIRHILTRRGIRARPENVLITMGAQNALWLIAQLLLTQRRLAVIERPCYPGFREVLAETRCRTVEVPVDEDGLIPDALPRQLDVLFTTPSHHSPTNATLTLERRRALLALAEARGFAVVEDDYEFELAYSGTPLPSLKSLDEAGSVIHVGSFSKSLFPGLRLGYLVAPAAVVDQARRLRGTVLRHPPWHIQRTAAYFLSLGHYDAQINRMKKAYYARRAVMEDSIERLGLQAAGKGQAGGSCFWMDAGRQDTEALAERLRGRGVVIEPGRTFYGDGGPTNFYRLAYSSIAASKIAEGMKLIGEELD